MNNHLTLKINAQLVIQTELRKVVLTRTVGKTFEDYTNSFALRDMPYDKKLRVCFDGADVYGTAMTLLRFNCPDRTCDVFCRNWGELKAHVQKAHKRMLW
jgi:hypothetical protein